MKKYLSGFPAFLLAITLMVTSIGFQVSAAPQAPEPEVIPTIDEPTDYTASEEDIQAVLESQIAAASLPGTNFDDISADAWYTPYVEYVMNKGIMTGKGNNIFAPAEIICRAQFATILYRLSASEPVGYNNRFPDVPDGQFYTTPVLWAAQDEVNIISGYEDSGLFGPNDMITREQLAVMLYRYAKYQGLDTKTSTELDAFPDADAVSAFAEDAMKWAVGIGIITGDNGLLNPQGGSARAVCAAMIQRFCTKLLPEELPDVEMNASVSQITLTPNELDDGSFWIKLDGVTASHDIQKIIVTVWNQDDQSDIGYYYAEPQEDGSYGFSANVANHGFHFGTYHASAFIFMENGIRLFGGQGSGEINSTAADYMYQTAQNYSSGTNYLILVDTTACKTAVFYRNGNSWEYLYFWPCAPGTPDTPTVKGVFSVTSLKMPGFYSFGSYQYYATQFYGDFLFHSTTFNTDGSVQDDRLGMQLSHGCVRLSLENAKWIYDNIPAGTTVYIY